MRENMLITHLRGCTALFFLLWLPAIIFFFFSGEIVERRLVFLERVPQHFRECTASRVVLVSMCKASV